MLFNKVKKLRENKYVLKYESEQSFNEHQKLKKENDELIDIIIYQEYIIKSLRQQDILDYYSDC